jgi:hypothetical protein
VNSKISATKPGRYSLFRIPSRFLENRLNQVEQEQKKKNNRETVVPVSGAPRT